MLSFKFGINDCKKTVYINYKSRVIIYKTRRAFIRLASRVARIKITS